MNNGNLFYYPHYQLIPSPISHSRHVPATAEETYSWNIIWIIGAAILQPCKHAYDIESH